MKKIDKLELINRSAIILDEIVTMLSEQPSLAINELPHEKTVFIMIDMVNGFAKEGALESPRVKEIIPEIVSLSKRCDTLGIEKIAFADAHKEISPEFQAYPIHCIEGSIESEIVDEIKAVGGYTLIKKNSTNGFLEEQFQEWLKQHGHVDHFIVVGDCTDICIQQFTVTLATWFNKQDKKSQIIVPINGVDTYDFNMHNGDLMQVMALYTMQLNGIKIVKNIV